LGGNSENACTIHSAYYRQKGNAIRMRYNAHKEILIADEVRSCSLTGFLTKFSLTSSPTTGKKMFLNLFSNWDAWRHRCTMPTTGPLRKCWPWLPRRLDWS
jgi:hypothetical protein